MLLRWHHWLHQPVNNSSLVLFRILFGCCMVLHALQALVSGQVYHDFIAPPFTFSYIGLELWQPLPGYGMYVYVAVMALCALAVMTGAWYRKAALGLALLWTGLYWMQKANYNNHYYLMLLLCWFMVWVPAERRFSFDLYRGKVSPENTCARWIPFLFIAQTAIMYFFAGINKLDPDWLSGRYLHIQFSRYRAHQYLSGFYNSHPVQVIMSYAGLAFDFLIVPLFCFKRSRPIAWILSFIFHAFNAYSFRIGVFPVIALSLNVFFHQSWPVPEANAKKMYSRVSVISARPAYLITMLLMLYLCWQLLMPLRHWAYPGYVYWTDEGYRMSWMMMLRTKSGSLHYRVTDEQGHELARIHPSVELSPFINLWLLGSPDMIWQYAQRIKTNYREKENRLVKVYAISSVSLNRWAARPLIDSTVDLGSVRWQPFRHADWIMPFERREGIK